MSSKILGSELLGGDLTSAATPMLWRMVAAVGDARGRSSSHADAEHEAARKLDQARREAYAEGLAAGRQQAEELFRPAVQGLADTLDALARLRENIREETTQDLVHLAISIAARVIHREVAVDPDALGGLIQAAFSKLQSREINRVRMHPTLEALVRKLLEQGGAPKNLVLTPDPSLKPAEVFFETSQGILDASVETQLREIERGLIDKLER
jgi:flagellar assembly protein FliH